MRNTTKRLRSAALLLIFLSVPLWLSAQTTSVRGTVKDAYGDVLIGASVLEQGTTNGVITDINGAYSLAVASGASLEFSYMGYVTQVVAVGGRTVVDVILDEDNQFLDEVVVIGYGTQRREAVTGSVASMQGDALREVQSGNITYALAGRLPGVQMNQSSSKPGADMQIRIRGTRSLSGDNDPLVVLDGVPFSGTIADINPNDIKTIDILKDASSTAIYGSRGANGVIIVTTNKGVRGQKARVSYDGYYGIKTLYSRYPMMTGDELYEMRGLAGIYADADGNPTMGADEVKGVNTDWQDLMFSNAMTTNHNVGISGGTAGGSYTFGMGYLRDESLLPEQNFNRISLRASLDQQIGEYLRFGLTSNNSYSTMNGDNLGMYNTIALSPLIDPYNADGSQKMVVRSIADNYWGYTRDAVENLGDSWADNRRTFATYNSIFGEVRCPWLDGLSYRITLGLDLRTSNRGTYTGMGVFSDTPTAASVGTLDKSLRTNWMVENLLTYEQHFDKHHLTLNALYSAEQRHYDRSYVRATNIPSDHFQYWNLGQAASEYITVNPGDQQYEVTGLESWMARAMYDYDSRYMLLASFRRDGSSRLAPGHKWINYGAVSAGWNIGKEDFLSDVDWLDMLKLRIGWGTTSNQSVRPYATQGRLGTRPYNFGVNQFETGFYVSETPNPELGWEFSDTWNVGLDFGFLQNRLMGTVEWYTSTTNDVIQWVNLPSSAGVGGYYANIGEVKNSGFEVALTGVIFDGRDDGWYWDMGINFYFNRNEITKLATGQEEDAANCWFVGHSINSIYDYEYIGLWQEGDPHLDILEPGGNVGMIKVKYDGEYENGVPVRQIGADDRQIINADPNFLGGFNTRVAYKGFDLNILGTFQNGGKLVSSLHASNGYLNMLTGRRGNVKVDYWTPTNTDAKYPKPGGIQSGDNQKYGSTLGYFDATYFKVGSITLGYNFNTMDWAKQAGLSNARLYFTVQNAFVLFSPYNNETGLDPVTNSYGNQNAAVTTSLPYNSSTMLTVGTNVPSSRNFIFGLSLSF